MAFPTSVSTILAVILCTLAGCDRRTETASLAQTAQPGTATQAPAPKLPEAEHYVPPPDGTLSLIQELRASRDEKGGLVIELKALLPKGTGVYIQVFAPSSKDPLERVTKSTSNDARLQTEKLGDGGTVRSAPFVAPVAGAYRVEVSSSFNGNWQNADVLALVGNSGTKLPTSALEPDDREFPKAGGSLKFSTVVNVEGPPAAMVAAEDVERAKRTALEAVKNSKLFVQDKGQATDTVQEIVVFFQGPGWDFHPGEWSVSQAESGKWKVSLAHKWGTDAKVANWQYDPATREVNYLDPEAKMLSWIPKD
jgi:hypothetical protein